MVVALVLASCGPAEVEEEEVVTPEEEELAPPEEEEVVPEEGVEMVKLRLEKLDGTVVEKWVEKPKYGGMFISATGQPPLGWDEAYTHGWAVFTFHLTNDELTEGDWARGPGGTGELSCQLHGVHAPHLWRGCVAERWEAPDFDTLIYHIRKGIHFWLSADSEASRLVGGRELTADDVVYSLKRLYEIPGGSIYVADPEQRPIITAPDKWTVIIKRGPKSQYPDRPMSLCFPGDYGNMIAPEVIEKYEHMRDWRQSHGTGPFMLVDYVSGSSITFVRNPNYWGKDPLHPENALPYLDGIKELIIPDASTRLAALRTAKIDYLPGVGWEDRETLMKTNPELKELRAISNTSWNIWFRMDNPEQPWHDIKVRRALAMAIDNQAIAESLYHGDAELVTTVIMPAKEVMCMYTPLEELPESTQELYEYYPDKARQLLAEAGYPDGFKAKIITYALAAEILSVVKDYWNDVGVDIEIDVREYAVWNTIQIRRSYDELLHAYSSNSNISSGLNYFAAGQWLNRSFLDDPKVNEANELIYENMRDWDKLCEIYKEITPHILGLCSQIELPTPYYYTVWQPWVKGYHGEYCCGFWDSFNFRKWIWIDQDVKEEMTGRR